MKKQDYIFNVSVVNGAKGIAWRLIQISGQATLYKFAQTIVDAFDFNFDHCFGFYDTLDRRLETKKVFEYFKDIGEEPTVPWAKGVKKSKVCDAFQTVGEKLIFLFDYGDNWHFSVNLTDIREGTENKKPIVLKSSGEAPEQYPPCEDL